MAELDAKVQPEQDPNWMFFSRPGSENPKGNEGMKELAQGVDKAFVGGLDFADKAMEQHVQNTVFDVEQKNRMDFISTAQGLKNDSSVSPGKQEDILSGNNLSNAPPAVQTAVQKVQTVSQARDAGKVDKFGYFQRVIPELQAVRAQYPGYRHVVDQALGNNANAEMNTMVQELNRRDSEAREDGRRQLSEVTSMGKEGLLGPNWPQAVMALQNGKADYATIMKQSAPFVARAYEAKAAMQSKEIYEWNEVQTKQNVGSDADKQFRSIAAGQMIWPNVASGNGGVASGQSAQQNMNRLGEMINTNKIDPVEAEARARQLDLSEQQTRQSMWEMANKPYANGKSMVDILGAEGVKARIEANLQPWQAYKSMVGKPETYAMADSLLNNIKATNQGDEWAAMNDKQTGQMTRNMQVLKTTMGEQAMPFVMENLMGGDLQGYAKALQQRQLTNIWGGQPDADGHAPSVGAETAYMKAKGISTPTSYTGLIDQVDNMNNKKTPVSTKLNIAKAFFADSDSNRNFISNFSSSTYDGRRWHNGAEDIFSKLASPQTARQIMELKDAGLAKDYQNTLDVWAKTLLSRNLGTLNEALTQEGSESSTPKNFHNPGGAKTTSATPAIKLTWDSERNIPDVTPEARRYLIQTRQRATLDSITKLQMVTSNMAGVLQTVQAAGYDRDMRTYILKFLQTEGLDIQDLPASQQLHKAIEATAPRKAEGQAQE